VNQTFYFEEIGMNEESDDGLHVIRFHFVRGNVGEDQKPGFVYSGS
jgi:hypothetical protein